MFTIPTCLQTHTFNTVLKALENIAMNVFPRKYPNDNTD